MQNTVPVVAHDLLIEVNQKVAADRETFGSPDIMVSAVSALHKRTPPTEIMAVVHRLLALASFLQSGEGKKWLKEETGKDYVLLNEALFRAAARVPLLEKDTIGEMTFERTQFLQAVLEEAKTEGAA